jgi:hypothetical protein
VFRLDYVSAIGAKCRKDSLGPTFWKMQLSFAISSWNSNVQSVFRSTGSEAQYVRGYGKDRAMSRSSVSTLDSSSVIIIPTAWHVTHVCVTCTYARTRDLTCWHSSTYWIFSSARREDDVRSARMRIVKRKTRVAPGRK